MFRFPIWANIYVYIYCILFQSIVVNVNIKEIEQYKDEKFQEEKYPVTGKLIVYCTDPEFSYINWVYYLRGIFE